MSLFWAFYVYAGIYGDREHNKVKSKGLLWQTTLFKITIFWVRITSSAFGFNSLFMKNENHWYIFFSQKEFRKKPQVTERRINLPLMELTCRKNLKSISCLKAQQHWWCLHIFSLFPLLACYQRTHIMHITHKSFLYLN